MSIDLPNAELLTAIEAGAETAGCADVQHATAVAIEAYTKGEFADETQIASWFALARVKQPKLFAAVERATDHATPKAKGDANPFAPNYKGADRNKAIADYIRKFGTASASRMAASAGADIAGRPLRA